MIQTNQTQDFELNLASIIDCFTVIVTFLLAGAGFLSLGILDAGVVAPNGATAVESPQSQVDIELRPNGKIAVKLPGNSTQLIEAESGKQNYSALVQFLQEAHNTHPQLNAATLHSEGEILYGEIVKAMEEVRKVFPSISLTGVDGG